MHFFRQKLNARGFPKKSSTKFHSAIAPKLRQAESLNFGGRQSHEFAIFVNNMN